jgi:hypothetical protein
MRTQSVGRATAKPAAATRAHWRQGVRTWCTWRTGNKLAQWAAGYKALHMVTARCRLVSRGVTHAGSTARHAVTGEALRSRCFIAASHRCVASLRAPQPSQLQPRLRIAAIGCAQGATGAYTCPRVLTGAQQAPPCRPFLSQLALRPSSLHAAGYNACCLHCARSRVVPTNYSHACASARAGTHRAPCGTGSSTQPNTGTGFHVTTAWRKRSRTAADDPWCVVCVMRAWRAHTHMLLVQRQRMRCQFPASSQRQMSAWMKAHLRSCKRP